MGAGHTVYNILNYFYYSKEFLIWLDNNADKDFSELDGKLDKKWIYIKKFERTISEDAQGF